MNAGSAANACLLFGDAGVRYADESVPYSPLESPALPEVPANFLAIDNENTVLR